LFLTSCGPSFSGHGYATQSAANTSCPHSDRFWLRELRVSRHFSTFYGPSVQAMDTQLHALPTLPVLTRTVSGCVNSAFLDISQHFTGHLFRQWIPNSTRYKTLPVLARTVSGYLNSAFLGL